MFKRFLLAVALILPVTVMAQKFGVVEIESVLMDMPQTVEMNSTLEKLSKQYEDQFMSMQNEVNQKYADYQKMQSDATVSESIKELKINEIQELTTRIEQFRNTAMNELQRQRETLMMPIQRDLFDAIRSIGAEESFTIILPKDQALLLYQGTDVVDLTSKVRTRLGLPAAPAAPAAQAPAN